jgi:hypothetical protein
MFTTGCDRRRVGLSGIVSLKGGLHRVVIQQLMALGIRDPPIPKYDAQSGTWQRQRLSPSLMPSAVAVPTLTSPDRPHESGTVLTAVQLIFANRRAPRLPQSFNQDKSASVWPP